MAAAAVDRLSALPGEVLRRVLYFAPAKEGASTAVLARRWRTLWRTSGAVNIDWRSYHRAHGSEHTSYDTSKVFLGGIQASLAAADGLVTRLTFHAEVDRYVFMLLMNHDDGVLEQRTLIDVALAHPAARHVEELRVAAVDTSCRQAVDEYYYQLSFGSLPSESLRDLHIVNCSNLTAAPPGTYFPRLTALRLQGCTFPLDTLQDTIDAAPQLVTLHLESSYFRATTTFGVGVQRDRLICPAVTALVFADCSCRWSNEEEEAMLELDLPRLRYFRYEGHVPNRLSLMKPQAVSSSSLVRADLRFTEYQYGEESKIFWQFIIQNFNMVKVLKLKLDFPLQRIAIADEKEQDDLLSNNLFQNVEHLELEGCYGPAIQMAGMAIGDLLHSCPVVHDLQLNVIPIASVQSSFHSSLERQAQQLDFDKSVDHFRQRRRRPISLGKNDNETYDQVSDVPGLSERSFYCLQSSLRKVSVHSTSC